MRVPSSIRGTVLILLASLLAGCRLSHGNLQTQADDDRHVSWKRAVQYEEYYSIFVLTDGSVVAPKETPGSLE